MDSGVHRGSAGQGTPETSEEPHLPGWKISDEGIELFRPQALAVTRYRYRGTKIPTPWATETEGSPAPVA